jgi:hypothetical protein
VIQIHLVCAGAGAAAREKKHCSKQSNEHLCAANIKSKATIDAHAQREWGES